MNLIDMEILKATECCTKGKYHCPTHCPRYNNSDIYIGECRFELLNDVSKLLYRLRAENDKHLDEIRWLQEAIATFETGKTVTPEKAIGMIDEYLQEPNSISADWVEALKLCRDALRKEVRPSV